MPSFFIVRENLHYMPQEHRFYFYSAVYATKPLLRIVTRAIAGRLSKIEKWFSNPPVLTSYSSDLMLRLKKTQAEMVEIGKFPLIANLNKDTKYITCGGKAYSRDSF
jgi:hypothetical protein